VLTAWTRAYPNRSNGVAPIDGNTSGITKGAVFGFVTANDEPNQGPNQTPETAVQLAKRHAQSSDHY